MKQKQYCENSVKTFKMVYIKIYGTDWEIFLLHIYDHGFVFRICKELLQLEGKSTTQYINGQKI